MTDVLGLSVEDALIILESENAGKPVRIQETSGYKASQDMDTHNEIRVVGIRESDSEIILIIARF